MINSFRDIFIQSLEHQAAQLPVCSANRPSIDIEQSLEAMEYVVGLPLDPSGPQALLAAVANKLAWDTGFPYQVGSDIVHVAWLTALGQSEKIVSKALLFGLEYMQIINSLRPAVGGQEKLIQVHIADNGDGGRIIAFANDGHSMIRHECECYMQGESFSGYIGIPAFNPGKLELVTLSPTGADTVVECGDRRDIYSAPVYRQDFRTIWSDLVANAEKRRKDVLLNPTFLRDMAAGMRAGTLTPQPMRISLGIENEPISVECGPTQAIFMPLVDRERAS